MPELPEMENYKNLLQRLIGGKTISATEVNREKSVNIPVEDLKKQTVNQSVTQIVRYGKALFFHLSSGQLLFLHLMLGGKLYFGTEKDAPDHTKQVILTFGEESLFFIGLRLGYLHIISLSEYEKHVKGLGADAFSEQLTPELFIKRLQRKRSPLKTVLTDQKFIAGIGNRYSDEICFAAGYDPRRSTHELTEDKGSRLYNAMRQVLREAIQAGGYMDMPLFHGDGLTGGYAAKMKVHGLEGEPCPRCGSRIKMVEVSSKKTYFCPNCQV